LFEPGFAVSRAAFAQQHIHKRVRVIHILNGQLLAVMIDDDPASSNNQSGLIGIEIEATTKVAVKDLWLKKLN